jgi:hypothetical protein
LQNSFKIGTKYNGRFKRYYTAIGGWRTGSDK